MEWEVYLADGSTRDSARHTWDDIPDGVLVVRVWGGPKGNMLLWGDAYYGRPDTLKMEGQVTNDEFERVLELARGNRNPPSKR